MTQESRMRFGVAISLSLESQALSQFKIDQTMVDQTKRENRTRFDQIMILNCVETQLPYGTTCLGSQGHYAYLSLTLKHCSLLLELGWEHHRVDIINWHYINAVGHGSRLVRVLGPYRFEPPVRQRLHKDLEQVLDA